MTYNPTAGGQLPDLSGYMAYGHAWDSGNSYDEGNVVRHGGVSYVCIAMHSNQQPPNASYWDVLGDGVGSGAPTDATYITQTANGSLSAEQALSTLTTGLVKVTNGTGALSTASASDLPSHASSHQSGGSDAIKLDDLAAPDDNTDLDVSTSLHGLAPKAPNDTTKFLRGDGTWAVPAGTGEAFPVGSVFIAVVSTNPGTLLGYGTWSAFATGRMLIGLDSGDTDYDVVEETGGAKTHTLVEANLPAHSHSVTDSGHTHGLNRYPTTTGGSSGFTADTSMSGTPTAVTLITQSATTGITIGNTGSGTAVNHMPPYIAVYMWKRTA